MPSVNVRIREHLIYQDSAARQEQLELDLDERIPVDLTDEYVTITWDGPKKIEPLSYKEDWPAYPALCEKVKELIDAVNKLKVGQM